MHDNESRQANIPAKIPLPARPRDQSQTDDACSAEALDPSARLIMIFFFGQGRWQLTDDDLYCTLFCYLLVDAMRLHLQPRLDMTSVTSRRLMAQHEPRLVLGGPVVGMWEMRG